LQGATFRNFSGASIVKLTNVNAEGAFFDDFAGRLLSIVESDLSGARIVGDAGAMPTVWLSRQSSRLDRAELRNVKIEVESANYGQPLEVFDTSLDGTRIEHSVISCRLLSPDSVERIDEKHRRESEQRRLMSSFLKDIAFARALKALGGTNQFDDDCRRKIDAFEK